MLPHGAQPLRARCLRLVTSRLRILQIYLRDDHLEGVIKRAGPFPNVHVDKSMSEYLQGAHTLGRGLHTRAVEAVRNKESGWVI